MSVIPFRRPKKREPPAETKSEPSYCPQCGWLMPTVVKVDRASVKEQLMLYIDCPECGANLFLLVEFT